MRTQRVFISGIVFAVIAVFTVAAPLAAQSTISGTELVLNQGVIDLRENPQIRKRGLNGPAGFHSAADLEIGSVFIDTNNEARKVVDIYEDHGKKVIETVEPRIEEVLSSYYIPDQEIHFTREDIDPVSVSPGVSVLDNEPLSRSTKPGGSLWLETDPKWMGEENNIQSFLIDKPIWQGKKSTKQNKTTGKGWDSTTTGEVRIKGILRLAGPVLRAGSKMPVMKVTWVKVWWCVGYPKFSFEDGYLHASFNAAQQFDLKLIGNIQLDAEKRIPLYGWAVEKNGVKFAVGAYLKITVEGDITVEFEISEYTDLNVWGTLDLVWPFIPVNVHTGSGAYVNFSVRPSIAAEAEAKSGLYLGVVGKVLGITLFGSEVGGGIYATADGYMEAKGVLGYNSNDGVFGSWRNWLYDISLEIGAYIEGDLGVAGWNINLFDKRWPFLNIDEAGEFGL